MQYGTECSGDGESDAGVDQYVDADGDLQWDGVYLYGDQQHTRGDVQLDARSSGGDLTGGGQRDIECE
jgi:hypothetical protein